MHNILQTIIELKKQDTQKQKPSVFLDVFKKKRVAIIGEVKFASPTHTNLLSRKKLMEKIELYTTSGVDAISLITEKNVFNGDPTDVLQVKKKTMLPILQKDFVIDIAQILQSKALGSDGLLLIARIVDTKTLQFFVKVCLACGIEPVVEINSARDLKKALTTQTRIIAVNARDLQTFHVDVEKACRLLKKIPVGYVKLGFSGIIGVKEVALYTKAGAHGILIGTTLTKEVNVDAFLSSLKQTI